MNFPCWMKGRQTACPTFRYVDGTPRIVSPSERCLHPEQTMNHHTRKSIVPKHHLLGLLGATALIAASLAPAKAQVGSGWLQYTPSKSYHGGVSQSQRYSISGSTEHFWVFSSDPHFSSNDSGPRSEWKVNNTYSSGSQQFQGNFNAESGTSSYTVFQIFGSLSGATSIQLQMRSGNGTLRRYNEEIVATGCWGVYKRINVIHYTSTGKIETWVNGSASSKQVFNDGGNTSYYFKYGTYDTPSATSRTGCYWQSVKFFRK